MKKGKALMIIAVMMISSIFAVSLLAISVTTGNAVKIPRTLNNEVIYVTGGQAVKDSLQTNPEYLKIRTASTIDSETIITVIGLDENGQQIEATVDIPESASESQFLLNDSISDMPVAFANILNITQRGGTENDMFELWTQPEPWTNIHNNWAWFEYLGEYHIGTGPETGWEAGDEHPAFNHDGSYTDPNPPYNTFTHPLYFLNGRGPFTHPAVLTTPPEPSNPDPIQVFINWIDQPMPNGGDLLPEGPGMPWGASPNEFASAGADSNLLIEGLDEAGNKLIGTATIHVGDVSDPVTTPGGHTFSVICNVMGGAAGESYYILTNPVNTRKILTYILMIDHLVIYPHSYDILANPDFGKVVIDRAGDGPDGSLNVPHPASTDIDVIFVDIDGNAIHSSAATQPTPPSTTTNIFLNYYTSGGTITPGEVKVPTEEIGWFGAYITGDTNPRTIKVVVDAIVPACAVGQYVIPPRNLRSFVEMTMDGVSSALPTTAWPIHQLVWGYNDTQNPAGIQLPVTPKPDERALLDYLAAFTAFDAPGFEEGTAATMTKLYDGGNRTITLDGPIYEVAIPLYLGCNLISSPVQPIMGSSYYWRNGSYYSGTYPTLNMSNTRGSIQLNSGIPMVLLFHETEGSETISSIWWYDAAKPKWYVYIPEFNLWNGGPGGNMTCGDLIHGPFFTDGVGYWIKAEQPCTLEFSGILMENAPFTPDAYTLTPQKWNLIGFTSINPLTPTQYFEGAVATSSATSVARVAPVWMWVAQAQAWVRDPATYYPTNAFWVFTTAVSLAP